MLVKATSVDRDVWKKIMSSSTGANQRLPLAGSAYQETKLWAHFGNNAETKRNWEQFIKE